MIGLEPMERFLELPHGHVLVPSMGTHLGHDKDPVAPAAQGLSHPFLAAVIVVFPGIVKEVHARVDGLVSDTGRFPKGSRLTQRIAADADDGDLLTGAAE